MVVCVDVGNTNIVLGAFEADRLLFTSRLQTEPGKTSDQYAIAFNSILHLYHCAEVPCEGAIISCVVPPLLTTLKTALARLLGCRVLAVGPGVKTGLNIKIADPASTGADLVCDAVGTLAKYPQPSIIFDLGTATKILALDKFGNFLGGSIMPGIGISLNALSTQTAQLPHIDLDSPGAVIGTGTVDCMKSGIVFGTASMMDGMVRKFRAVLGDDACVVATGGYAGAILPFCETEITHDPDLMMNGLYAIYKRNANN